MPTKRENPSYSVWNSMKQRCYNKKNNAFHRYGGRGIKICDEWRYDFSQFDSDMGERPQGMTIERINNNIGYTPDNCKWATRAEQMLNRCNTVFVTIEGNKHKATELARIAKKKLDTIVDRVNRGLSYNDVISEKKFINLDGLALGGRVSGDKRKAMTHCKRGHEFTPENTYQDKKQRYCKKCHNLREKIRRRKVK